jgi:hypothetical protein
VTLGYTVLEIDRRFLSFIPIVPGQALADCDTDDMNTYRTVPTRVSTLPDGTALARYCMTLGESRGDTHKALIIAERWRDTPQVKHTLDLRTKAAVAPGTTSDATWAGPVAAHGIAGEVSALLRGASILGALEGKFRRAPFRTQPAARGWRKARAHPSRRLPTTR